jgi:photosystem II stability/assembly factor-like uncharacterized protein
MKRLLCLLFPCLLCLFIPLSFATFTRSTCVAQEVEKLRIDQDTVSTVRSPWEFVSIDSKASLRGLCVFNDREIWTSGSRGTVAHSYDGGKNWRVNQIEGAEELDFRDVQAIDEGTAVVISTGSPGRIYRTTNGGGRWKLCYENKNPQVFFDSISFWNKRYGVAMSDPIDGQLLLVGTNDGGKSWRPLPRSRMPKIEPGEAGFAASGTNMCTLGDQGLAIALANGSSDRVNLTSRVLYSPDHGSTWSDWRTPIRTNKSSGIFSTCFIDRKHGCVVGGNFKKPELTDSNYAVTNDGGETWSTPSPRVPPSGYRSCVAKLNHGKEVYLIAVGPNGTDLSGDLGNKWHRFTPFNSLLADAVAGQRGSKAKLLAGSVPSHRPSCSRLGSSGL